MRKTGYLIVILMIVESCALRPKTLVRASCEAELPRLFGRAAKHEALTIVGKVRIDLPTYRVRGLCRIIYLRPGGLRIDFRHSSLFGAYSEDASIYVRSGMITIYDRERGSFFGEDSSLAILGDYLDFELRPDDVIYTLLLEVPSCSEFDRLELGGSEDAWMLKGGWRGRGVEVSGVRGWGPRRFRLCSNRGTGCYTINYIYDGGGGEFPSMIRISRENGTERLSLEIREVELEPHSWDEFETGSF